MARPENPKVLRDALEMLRVSGGQPAIRKDLVGALERLASRCGTAEPGHKVFTHPASPVHGLSFDCSHGANPEVKRNYPKSVLKLLRQYEADLITYLRAEMTIDPRAYMYCPSSTFDGVSACSSAREGLAERR